MIEFKDENYAYCGDEKYYKYIQLTNLTEDGHLGKSVGIEIFPDSVRFLSLVYNNPNRKLFKVEVRPDCLIYNELKQLTRYNINGCGEISNPLFVDEETNMNNIRCICEPNGNLNFSICMKAPWPESITIFKKNNPDFYDAAANVVNAAYEKLEYTFNKQK